MNLLDVLINLILNVYCTENCIHVESVFLFEHNFWEANQKIPEVDKGYLYGVKIKHQEEEKHLFDFNWFNNLYAFDEVNKLNYVRLRELDIDKTVDFLKSKERDKAFLRFDYFFTDVPFYRIYRFGINESQLKWYKNFKICGSTNKSTVEMTNDEHNNTIMHHVDERFGGLFAKGIAVNSPTGEFTGFCRKNFTRKLVGHFLRKKFFTP
jgi:hypothetical protein